MEKIKVFLADDHTILRESLVILLSRKEDIEVVGECGDGHEAFRRISELRPDVAVLDISIPNSTAWNSRRSSGSTCRM
jgi:DNA-binding NarL/FixJ family response regulator